MWVRKSGELGRLEEAPLGERHAMVDEVPVARPDEPDVRLEDDRPPAGGEQLTDDRELLDHGIGRVEVFEVVAHEHRSEVRGRERGVELEARRLHEPDIGGEHGAHVPDVGRPFLRRLDRPDEVAAIAGQVQDRFGRVHEPLQIPCDLVPDALLGADLAFVEARLVELVEGIAHRRPASDSAWIHGMTSSSIWSSVVVASKPRTSRALRTSGTRSWTSCSNGASLT